MSVSLKVLTPMKAIKAKCLDCCGGDRAEVKRCQITRCPLWALNPGRQPKPRTPAQQAADRLAGERLKANKTLGKSC